MIKRRTVFPFSFLLCMVTACGSSPAAPVTLPAPIDTLIPTFTPLTGVCATPSPDEFKDFINNSITSADSGKTFVTHVTSRFWIYLDDNVYPLHDLENAIPDGLLGYVSNGSIRGPQCYPIMYEAVKEGKGLLKLKDFSLSIVVDNTLPMSSLPLH